jgi:hypothetical protein
VAARAGPDLHRPGRQLPGKLTHRVLVWAERNFALDIPLIDGTTLRENVQSAVRQGADLPHDYKPPPPQPPELWRVLPIWYHLSSGRGYVDGIPMRIRETEIAAWSALRAEPLSAVEMKMLDAIENTWLGLMRKQRGASSA